ncbi:hypothetical protein B296_00001321 [Ensete ventricosum]|uniref:Uncharacterized protein n=1 Tax=Ensete ventricosum TaxID=4639 RepID=A0A427B5G7_ENSVE|nr:hypothetical protein B296_00001321 [Ensete ventricosum]
MMVGSAIPLLPLPLPTGAQRCLPPLPSLQSQPQPSLPSTLLPLQPLPTYRHCCCPSYSLFIVDNTSSSTAYCLSPSVVAVLPRRQRLILHLASSAIAGHRLPLQRPSLATAYDSSQPPYPPSSSSFSAQPLAASSSSNLYRCPTALASSFVVASAASSAACSPCTALPSPALCR